MVSSPSGLCNCITCRTALVLESEWSVKRERRNALELGKHVNSVTVLRMSNAESVCWDSTWLTERIHSFGHELWTTSAPNKGCPRRPFGLTQKNQVLPSFKTPVFRSRSFSLFWLTKRINSFRHEQKTPTFFSTRFCTKKVFQKN